MPDARRRFDMLVCMRGQLRVGGLCFVVLPGSCLSHSHTLTHDSFADCLRGVGLAPDLAAETPASAKLAYFECAAGAHRRRPPPLTLPAPAAASPAPPGECTAHPLSPLARPPPPTPPRAASPCPRSAR